MNSNLNVVDIVQDEQIISKCYFNKNRLIREDNHKFGKTIINDYDENANLVKRFEFSMGEMDKCEHMSTFTYSNHQLKSYNDEMFAYNSLGLPTTYRNAKFVWEDNNLLEIEGIATYLYNEHGRTSKITNNELTTFYFQNGKLICEQGKHLIYYHYNGDLIASFSLCANSTVRKFDFKVNSLGDITGIINQNNEQICKYYYDSLGNHVCFVLNEHNEYVNVEACSPIEMLSENYFIANLNPFLFRGFYLDKETGLYYHDNCYYDPEIGINLNTKKEDV